MNLHGMICKCHNPHYFKGDTDCLLFIQKIRIFWLECKWKDLFGLPKRKISEKTGFFDRSSKIPKQNFQTENVHSICFCY